MFRFILIALTCLIPLSAHTAETPEPVQQVTNFDSFELPEWFKFSFLDLSEDNLEATEDNKHLVVFFWQEFCAYCKNTIEKNLTQQSIRQIFDAHFDVVALNIWGDREVYGLDGEETTEKEIARSLNVQFTPTIIFLNIEGQSVLRLNGHVSPPEMQVALNYVQSKTYESQTIFEYLAVNQPQAVNTQLNIQPFIDNGTNLNTATQSQSNPFRTNQLPRLRYFPSVCPSHSILSVIDSSHSRQYSLICGRVPQSRHRLVKQQPPEILPGKWTLSTHRAWCFLTQMV